MKLNIVNKFQALRIIDNYIGYYELLTKEKAYENIVLCIWRVFDLVFNQNEPS